MASSLLLIGATDLHSQAQPPASGSSLADAAIDEEALAKDASTEINVKNADLTAIIRIFSKKTRRNFILDDRVKGKVSIYLPGKVSAEESLRILDSVLSYKGFASVPIGPNLWKIVPSKEARTSTIPTRQSSPDGTPGPEIITRLVQLKYIGADEVRQLIQQLISADGFITAYPSTNSLILIDAEDNIERLVELVSTLDVPFSNREMTIIPVTHADVKDVAEKISQILGIDASASSDTTAQAASPMDFGLELARARVRQLAMQSAAQGGQGMPTGQPSGQPSGAESMGSSVGTRAIQPKIIPDERTNSIIVVADEDTTARVQALISQLDSKIDLSGSQYWIYRCQHAKADELAEVLGGLVGSGGSRSSSTSQGGGLFDTGQDLISGGTRTANRSRTQDRLRSQSRTPGQAREPGNAARGVSSVELGENFSITADPSTNTLIIFASKADYEKILALLKKIDIKRRQVLVEAMLLEVGIDDSRTANSSWLVSGGGSDGGFLATNNPGNIASLLQSPQGVQDFAVAAASAGTLTLGGGASAITLPTQSILLNAVRSNSNVNILSAPTILTTDNEQAEIVVGSNVPFVTSTATNSDNLSNTFNQVERQDVGITLRLTPQISSGDSVTLKIFTEVSSLTSIDPSLGPTTSIRTSETSVITKDSQMIVIGGLMSDDINESERGVPFLKDIPVFGPLFKSTIERRRRTNLLILITPRIIRDQFDARDATITNRNRVEHAIREDELSPDRSELLRNRDIDSVAESAPYDGPKPSTIFEPSSSAASQQPDAGLNSGQGPNILGAPSAAAPVLEFSVEPKFLGSEGQLENRTNRSSENAPPGVLPFAATTTSIVAGSGVVIAENSRSQGSTGARFVVLQAEPGELKNSVDTPFPISSDERLVGIVVPKGGSSALSTFFSVGSSVRYISSGEALRFTVVGAFPSIAEATIPYPELSTSAQATGSPPPLSAWYTLSPYEIMSIGEGPWL